MKEYKIILYKGLTIISYTSNIVKILSIYEDSE